MTLNRHHDRCDRCGAQAWVRVTSPHTNRDLIFCGHHYTRHEVALFAAGWLVADDDRSRINTAPSPSAGVL